MLLAVSVEGWAMKLGTGHNKPEVVALLIQRAAEGATRRDVAGEIGINEKTITFLSRRYAIEWKYNGGGRKPLLTERVSVPASVLADAKEALAHEIAAAKAEAATASLYRGGWPT